MAWLIKSLRNAPPAIVALTAASTVLGHEVGQDQLDPWFHAFDQRGLAVTWAALRQSAGWQVARRMVTSHVAHELAYATAPQAIAHDLPLLDQQRSIARRAALPLRSLVTSGGGIHPSIMARLGVEAIVMLEPCSTPLPTTLVRSHGWNQWEITVAQRIRFDMGLTESTQLIARLHVALRDGATLHFLWDLATLHRPPRAPALRLLDCLADFSRRSQIEVATIGQLAGSASRPSSRLAA
jgi:hypothetical protein